MAPVKLTYREPFVYHLAEVHALADELVRALCRADDLPADVVEARDKLRWALCVINGGGYWYPSTTLEQRKRERSRMTPALRQAVIDRDGDWCQICLSRQGEMHVDHKVPIARGGKTELDNLVVLCATCNLIKGTLTYDEYERLHDLEWLRREFLGVD